MMNLPSIILGIIGPPCSGKSSVAEILESLGGLWINADSIAKEQLDEPEVIEQLVALFGERVLKPEPRRPTEAISHRAISRPAIANLVFGDNDKAVQHLHQLESIIHPRTRREIERRIEQAHQVADSDTRRKLIILDVPLLLENGWDARCDEVWCLKVAPDRQAALLAARGWTLDEVVRRERRQLPWSEKEARATRVIENHGTLDDLRRQVIDGLRQCLS